MLAPATPTVLTPPLKWAGGKRWQVPHIRPLWQPHASRRLVEPFCGGLAIALGLMPERALLNDANPHLINFYAWLKKGLRTDVEMKNNQQLFYRHRSRFNQLLGSGKRTTKEAAALFYYLNRTGYNGLCRFNQKGEFNVPFGQHKRINYFADFGGYASVFAAWTFTNSDVEDVPIEPGDFVYADPPYDVDFTNYAKDRFTWKDQERTAAFLSTHAGPVILVNEATKRVEDLYRQYGYEVRFFEAAPRRINCTGDRTPAREIMAMRNL